MRQGTNLAKNVVEMEGDVNAHMIAKQYAEEFNKSLARAGLATKTVKYHPVNLVYLEAGRSAPGPQTAMFLEPFLTGRYNCIFCIWSFLRRPVKSVNIHCSLKSKDASAMLGLLVCKIIKVCTQAVLSLAVRTITCADCYSG